MKVPLEPLSPFEVAKAASKPIPSLPISHFGTVLGSILEHFSSLICIYFLNDFEYLLGSV